MTASIIFFAILLAVGYALLASLPTARRVGLYAAMLVSAGSMLILAYGVPRPMWMQGRPLDGTLVGVSLDEGHAIYAWVRPVTTSQPVALRLPWSEQEAGKLQTIMRQGQKSGRPVRVSMNGIMGGGEPGNAQDGGKGKRAGRGDSLVGPDDPLHVRLAQLPQPEAKDTP